MPQFISASFLTTLNRPMYKRALSFLFPPKYKNLLQGSAIRQLENEIKKLICGDADATCIATYNARTALYQGMKLLNIGRGDEVILQAYTCVSVSNAIIATGAKPIYVDIEPSSLNINPKLIENHITVKTKAIIAQHTFGIPSDIHAIQSIVKKHQLFLIEDCAHALGATYKDQQVGSFGDLAVFSFGRDKVISSVNGGCLLVNNPAYRNTAEAIRRQLGMISTSECIKNLLYIVIGYPAYILYIYGIGKLLYLIAAKLHLFPQIVTTAEKKCHYTDLASAMPHALAYIALHELKNLALYNQKRKKNAELYHDAFGDRVVYTKDSGAIYLRCVYLTENVKKIQMQCKQENIYLGDRYQQVIAPKDADAYAAGYILGSCPVAEKLTSQTLNLPNHPGLTTQDIESVIRCLPQIHK